MYQSVAISLPNVPLEFARQTFFFATQEPDIVLGTTTWNVPMMDQTSAVFGFIFQDASPSCTGASKAFKTPSEPVVRVIATIMPGAIISHVVNKRGMSKLYINFTYALVDETGEVHPPEGREPQRDRANAAGGARDQGASAERRGGLLAERHPLVGGLATAARRRPTRRRRR